MYRANLRTGIAGGLIAASALTLALEALILGLAGPMGPIELWISGGTYLLVALFGGLMLWRGRPLSEPPRPSSP